MSVAESQPLVAQSPSRRAPCRVVLAGFGTVGRSVATLLAQSNDEASLVAVIDRRAAIKSAGWLDERVLWTESLDEALDAGADVFVELIGGLDPAEDWSGAALERGIPVGTANKQVIAQTGPALLELAASRGCQLRFEGAVAGGVPVIRAIESGLAGDTLTDVAGILNGTCNYILTRMGQDGVDFGAALAEAQALGFAEADPSMDVDGGDARAKLAILAMVALGVQAPAHAIRAEAIRAVSPVDFQYARRVGCTVRQVAWASRGDDDSLTGAVGPALVPLTSPLARVNGSENLVTVKGRFGGQTTFGGRGAGGDPTAVAVVSDVLGIARGARPPALRPAVTVERVSSDTSVPYYVRFTVRDRPGIVAALGSVFAARAINIDAVLQEPGFPASARPFIVSLDESPSQIVRAAIDEIARLDFNVSPPLAMPMLRI